MTLYFFFHQSKNQPLSARENKVFEKALQNYVQGFSDPSSPTSESSFNFYSRERESTAFSGLGNNGTQILQKKAGSTMVQTEETEEGSKNRLSEIRLTRIRKPNQKLKPYALPQSRGMIEEQGE